MSEWIKIGKYANELLAFFDRLNSNTEMLTIFLVFSVLVMGLVLIAYWTLDAPLMRIIEYIIGTTAALTSTYAISVFGVKYARNRASNFKKLRSEKMQSQRPLSKPRKEPKLEHK
jgi:uncharacterized protein YacL